MPPADEEATPLVAITLRPIDAARAILEAWDRGAAVLPLDPAAPPADKASVIDRLRPTQLVDEHGTRDLADGLPTAAGVAAVVRTTGTTGEPRGVELTCDARGPSAEGGARPLHATADDRWLCCLPVHHVAGLAVVARSWHSGTPLVTLDRFDVHAVAEAIAGGASLVSLVPTTLARLLDQGVPLGGLRGALVGAAPLPDALRARASAAGVPVTTTYGLTETWGGVLHDGRAIDGASVTLADDDEIRVRGRMVMRGYRRDRAGTLAALGADGSLHTGDVGRRLADGSIEVVDRLRDLVLTGGVTVSPTEVEQVLAAHPGVRDVCVAGRADEEWGELVVAYVVPDDPASPPGLAELRSFARDRLGPAKAPRLVVHVATIPRTASGKAVRRLLEAQPSVDER